MCLSVRTYLDRRARTHEVSVSVHVVDAAHCGPELRTGGDPGGRERCVWEGELGGGSVCVCGGGISGLGWYQKGGRKPDKKIKT